MNLALLEAGHLRVQFIPGPLYEDSEMMCIWLISPVQSYELFPGLSLQLYSYPQFIYMIDLIWIHQTYGMAQYWLNIQIMTRMELVVSQINRPRETLGVKAPGTGVYALELKPKAEKADMGNQKIRSTQFEQRDLDPHFFSTSSLCFTVQYSRAVSLIASS